MYYLLCADAELSRVDELPFEVPDDLPGVVGGDPAEVFRLLSPVSRLPLVGLARRSVGRDPISVFLTGALAALGHRAVTGPLAIFGLEADGRTYRDLTNEEMDGFALERDASGTPALHLHGDASIARATP